ncbi:GNAT family N-acetyltransferase [Phycicoccus sp. Soil748]|uniref:GNAT family N-acetyltransferase n=1 Tax=Phycicoccus sp. Soil748 TaxID=1736397 RepID=UPI0007038ABD|nr:GNAT family N-acetyltransferase [Phycicoccus sp. Soil748]KRE54674.1 GCN5 family acetyltransferase [Phycicoccus sp. Soil748]
MSVIGPLNLADLETLIAVQREGAVASLGHIFPQKTHPFPEHQVREGWKREIADPDVDCFVINDAGRVAGFAATRADELLHFGTAVSTWGTGLAGLAHTELLEHLRAKGHREIFLRVFDENTRATRFYLRRGWVRTDETTRTTFPPHPTLRRYEQRLP